MEHPAPRKSIEDYGGLYGTIAAVFSGEEAGKAASGKAVSDLESAAGSVEMGTFICNAKAYSGGRRYL